MPSETAVQLKEELSKFIGNLNVQAEDKLEDVKYQTLPMLVAVNGEEKNLIEKIKTIDRLLTDQRKEGPAVVIVVNRNSEDYNPSVHQSNKEEYSLIKEIVKMDLKNNHLKGGTFRKNDNDKARDVIKNLLRIWNRKKVLVYDSEKGETTTSFINDLQKILPLLEFKDFSEANDTEKKFLHTIAVVRHVGPRCVDYLLDFEEKMKNELAKADVDDLGKVTVVYFYRNESEKEMTDEIEISFKLRKHKFAKIVVMDYVEKTLYSEKKSKFKRRLKKINECVGQEVSDFILSNHIKMEWSVDVYCDERSSLDEGFFDYLKKSIPSSIRLQKLQLIEELKNINSPTVIYTYGPFANSHQKIIEKVTEVTDLQNIMFFQIIKTLEDSTHSELSQQYGHFWNTITIRETFSTDMRFYQQFKSLVCDKRIQ